jgi:hypothetical protein
MTIAPLEGSTTTHEYQVAAGVEILKRTSALAAAGHSTLTVMARVWSGPAGAFRDARPWEGVTVVDGRGRVILDLGRDGRIDTAGDPFAVHTVALTPGSYFLRQRVDDGILVEQSLPVVKGWALEAYILRRVAPGRDRLDPRPRLSLLMHDSNDSMEDLPGARQLLETARVALADERRILSQELEELLLRKFRNPMAGILGAHLLLLEQDRNPSRNLSPLNEIVPNLRELLGDDHPDVEALSLRCPNESLRRTRAVKIPPILERSWTLLLEASRDRPALVARDLWRRVHAQGSLSPYFVWAIDETIKATSWQELARATWGVEVPEAVTPGSDVGALPSSAPATASVAAAPAMSAAVPGTGTCASLSPIVASRKTAQERARRLRVPIWAVDLLKKEKMAFSGSTSDTVGGASGRVEG